MLNKFFEGSRFCELPVKYIIKTIKKNEKAQRLCTRLLD